MRRICFWCIRTKRQFPFSIVITAMAIRFIILQWSICKGQYKPGKTNMRIRVLCAGPFLTKCTAGNRDNLSYLTVNQEDYFNDCGILRLDLRSDYERTECILEILSLIVPSSCALFGCQMVATKVPPFAIKRRAAVEQLGFAASKETLIGGHDKKVYSDYYVLERV